MTAYVGLYELCSPKGLHLVEWVSLLASLQNSWVVMLLGVQEPKKRSLSPRIGSKDFPITLAQKD
ncbi:hypothetical protein G4B88_021863 [Cannabis sativa]|uniref:Uncharacterized protein n=1 Tax=Cannabis sativa TaxID=3483 RepID=A0A7J6GZ07_CANSA|nr:hypothetical protein G4B88_021863 [Cannabis sativa]